MSTADLDRSGEDEERRQTRGDGPEQIICNGMRGHVANGKDIVGVLSTDDRISTQ
jgi:hypothetical protein